MDFINWLYSLKLTIGSFPFIIQVSIVFICLSLFMSIFLVIYLTIIRNTNRIKEKLQDNIAPKVSQLFMEIIHNNYLEKEAEVKEKFDEIIDSDHKKFRKNKKYKQDLAIESLIKIRQNYKEDSDRYSLIIRALNVEKYIGTKFSKFTYGAKKNAILELAELGLSTSDSRVLSYTYSSNYEIQTEARLSYLSLSRNDPYRFFDEIKGEMSDWSQIKLMNLLIEQSNTEGLPNFGKWIGYSKNDSLIIFLLKAATYFNQKKAIGTIREKIRSDNHVLRSEVIIALGKLKDVEIEDHLKNTYQNESDLCQISIIKAIGYLGSGKSLDFLKQSFYEATSLDIKKVIATVIFDYGTSGKKLFSDMKSDIKKQVDFKKMPLEINAHKENLYYNLQLFKHVENDLILYK